MIRALLLANVAVFGFSADAWALERWVCYGSPLHDPMARVVCGAGWSEPEARNQCGFDVVNILCQRSGGWGSMLHKATLQPLPIPLDPAVNP